MAVRAEKESRKGGKKQAMLRGKAAASLGGLLDALSPAEGDKSGKREEKSPGVQGEKRGKPWEVRKMGRVRRVS